MTAVILAARRSPVVPRGGALSALDDHALAAPVITALLADAGLAPDAVDELILSAAIGLGGNPARRAALAAGLPERVAGLSTDRQCAGGMDAVLLARALVESGAAEVVVAGGAESYSRAPQRSRQIAGHTKPQPYDQAPFTPWPDRDPDMAEAADLIGRELGIDRAAQEAWTIESHAKALEHPPGPQEIVPLAGLETDPFARRLSPALCRRAPVLAGEVTAATTAHAADGAAFVLVTSEARARQLGQAGATILGGATLGADPLRPGLAPLSVIRQSLQDAGLRADDLSAIEVMEAYAVQAIACVRGADFDPARVNMGGGGLARGHPVGASGAVNTVRLWHELAARGGTGLATIAAAGGIGSALILEWRGA